MTLVGRGLVYWGEFDRAALRNHKAELLEEQAVDNSLRKSVSGHIGWRLESGAVEEEEVLVVVHSHHTVDLAVVSSYKLGAREAVGKMLLCCC